MAGVKGLRVLGSGFSSAYLVIRVGEGKKKLFGKHFHVYRTVSGMWYIIEGNGY